MASHKCIGLKQTEVLFMLECLFVSIVRTQQTVRFFISKVQYTVAT